VVVESHETSVSAGQFALRLSFVKQSGDRICVVVGRERGARDITPRKGAIVAYEQKNSPANVSKHQTDLLAPDTFGEQAVERRASLHNSQVSHKDLRANFFFLCMPFFFLSFFDLQLERRQYCTHKTELFLRK